MLTTVMRWDIINPIYRMGKLRLREVNLARLPQGMIKCLVRA
jgi:hypothetical protein